MLPWRLHRMRLMGVGFATWLLGGLVFTLLAVVVAPMVLGFHTFTVRSGSMTPTIRTGDLIVTRTIAPSAARPGDIVTFHNPEFDGDLTTHRVRSMRADGDQLRFVTRGDANSASESWSVDADGSIGRLSYRVPLVGYALSRIGSEPGRLALVGLPALILLALGLMRIWTPSRVGASRRLGTEPAGEST